MEEIFARLYDMTAFSNIIADPSFLVMYAIAFYSAVFGYQKALRTFAAGTYRFRCAHCQLSRWRDERHPGRSEWNGFGKWSNEEHLGNAVGMKLHTIWD